MPTELFKAHGLGNDYLVWMGEDALGPGRVRALCDRHGGPGADGVLEPTPSARADHGVRIWNPDGSVAEKSGNGLRIYARWLVDFRGAPPRFTVDTGHDVVRCEVLGEVVRVWMGRARLPGSPTAVEVDDRRIEGVAVDVGNPHFVCFVEEMDRVPWRRWGAAIEVHPAFPRRTNVQFARVVDGALHLRIWERGAGATRASGSSACAAAAAAVHTGRLPRGPVAVHMPGGTLRVEVGDDDELVLEGPVTPVGRFTLDPRWPG